MVRENVDSSTLAAMIVNLTFAHYDTACLDLYVVFRSLHFTFLGGKVFGDLSYTLFFILEGMFYIIVEGFSTILWLERSFCFVLRLTFLLLSSSCVCCFGIFDDDASLLFLGLVGGKIDWAPPDSMKVSGRPRPVCNFPTPGAALPTCACSSLWVTIPV